MVTGNILGGWSLAPASSRRYSRRHLNSRFAVSPCSRAILATEAPRTSVFWTNPRLKSSLNRCRLTTTRGEEALAPCLTGARLANRGIAPSLSMTKRTTQPPRTGEALKRPLKVSTSTLKGQASIRTFKGAASIGVALRIRMVPANRSKKWNTDKPAAWPTSFTAEKCITSFCWERFPLGKKRCAFKIPLARHFPCPLFGTTHISKLTAGVSGSESRPWKVSCCPTAVIGGQRPPIAAIPPSVFCFRSRRTGRSKGRSCVMQPEPASYLTGSMSSSLHFAGKLDRSASYRRKQTHKPCPAIGIQSDARPLGILGWRSYAAQQPRRCRRLPVRAFPHEAKCHRQVVSHRCADERSQLRCAKRQFRE